MKITKDTSVWEGMKKRLLKDNKELRVGWFGDTYEDGTPVAYIAKLNEEGHINGEGAAYPGTYTPPRPFMRVGFMNPVEKGMYTSHFIESVQRIAEGKSTFEQEYRKLGPMVRGDLQEVIEDWSSPPNSPATVELKGFNNPLIETGKMHDSVGFMVANKGDD